MAAELTYWRNQALRLASDNAVLRRACELILEAERATDEEENYQLLALATDFARAALAQNEQEAQ